jgi:hypothetical protein
MLYQKLRQQKQFAFLSTPVLIGLLYGLAACSSGDGDGGGGSLVYSGNTSPIAISTTNAAELVSFIFGDEDLPDDLPLVPSSLSVESSAIGDGVINGALSTVVDMLSLLDLNNPGGVLTPVNVTMPCDSGVLIFEGSLDDQTVTGTLTVTYNDCVLDDMVFNGTGTLTILDFDTTYGVITDGILSFPLLMATSTTTIETDIHANIDMHTEVFIDANRERDTWNVVTLNNNTGTMLKVENQVDERIYAPSVLLPVSYTQTIQGRYYDSSHGYFDLTTSATDPLVYGSLVQTYPEDGSVQFSGASSALRLDVESVTHIVLSLDSDGDQVFETVTTLLWTEIDTDFAADIGDDDDDGMHNSWEVVYGLDPNDPADAVLDTDGDGNTNHQEYLDRTDPTTAG